MWPLIGAGAAVLAIGFEAYEHFFPKKLKMPPPGVLPNVFPPVPGQPVAPLVVSQQPVAPHKVPGGGFVYTAPQAPPDVLMMAAKALAAVNPCDASSEQFVRNFQAAAGLAQLNGGAGWNSVSPPGTDGRYGHDVAAVLQKYVSHAPPPCVPRPSWWGRPGAYTNNT